MYTHTQTDTQTRAPTHSTRIALRQTHKHTRTHAHTLPCTNAYALTHARTLARSHINTRSHTYQYKQRHARTDIDIAKKQHTYGEQDEGRKKRETREDARHLDFFLKTLGYTHLEFV